MIKISNLKLIIFALLILISFYLNILAQPDNSFNKTFSNGSRIYSQNYTITEFKSRPANVNEGVPIEKLFERQEWKLRFYELWLQPPDNRKPELFWVITDEYEVTQRRGKENIFSFVIDDVYLSDAESYVLYKTGLGLVVAKVAYLENIGWTTYPVTLLERDYGFRPIFSARFKKGKKPIIEAEYLSDKTDESGRAKKSWTWKLKNDKWIKVAK